MRRKFELLPSGWCEFGGQSAVTLGR